MRVLVVTDRLSSRGGADLHLRQVMRWAAGRGWTVTVAVGRIERGIAPPDGVALVRFRGLASAVESSARLGGLGRLLSNADVVHLQNVMNPAVIRRAVATGRAVATIQDHRVFCPGAGKTLPVGSRCDRRMSEEACRSCLPDDAYRRRTLELTAQRRDALAGARLVVLSSYMASELAEVGLVRAEVIPPWVEAGPPRTAPGRAVVMAGRLVSHKAVVDGWAAWDRAGRPLPLRIAGEGPLEDRLEGAVRLGWLDGDDLRSELCGARVVLFPSRWQEPFGIVGVEALAAGSPVVVADSGGTGEWSGSGCVRVASGDVAAMAEAVAWLAEDPAAAVRLGEEGRAMVAARFSRRLIEPRLERLYENVASAARGSPV